MKPPFLSHSGGVPASTLSERTAKLRKCAAFSLVEILTAITISATVISACYSSAGQAMRIVKNGKETAFASELLQQRIESFRSASNWSYVTTPGGIRSMITSATAAASNFPGATETITVERYPLVDPDHPDTNRKIVATRNPNGTIPTPQTLNVPAGETFATESCVKMTVKVTWTGTASGENGGTSRTREIVSILTRGGV